jgi:hypothetical protein
VDCARKSAERIGSPRMQALAGGPQQVDAVEVAAGDLELAALVEGEAAAHDLVGVGDQLGVEVARALGHVDAGGL